MRAKEKSTKGRIASLWIPGFSKAAISDEPTQGAGSCSVMSLSRYDPQELGIGCDRSSADAHGKGDAANDYEREKREKEK